MSFTDSGTLQRDLTSSFAPLKASLLITVGATEKDYRGDSWSGPNNDSEFFARSQDSFYKKTSGNKDRNKELLEEYLEKRAQAKRQQQKLLDEKAAKEVTQILQMVKGRRQRERVQQRKQRPERRQRMNCPILLKSTNV